MLSVFVGAFHKTRAFYKKGLASLDLLLGKDVQAVFILWLQDWNECVPVHLPMLNHLRRANVSYL